MFRIVLLVCACFLYICCKHDGKKKNDSKDEKFSMIEKLKWLEGSWENSSDESQSFEKWTRINDSTLTAYNYVLVAKDTVFAEQVEVQQRLNEVFFIVKVPDQNDSEAVTFKLTSSEEKTFTFENKNHDFPKRITYSNPVKDSIHAWIEGVVEGETRRIDFLYKRDNN